MSDSLPSLTDDEVRASASAGEAGFGSLRTSQGNLPLSTMDVRGRVTGLLVSTAVTQTFTNTHTEPLEATYIFPLPDRFAVTRFRLEVAGRVVEGELKERQRARQEYDQAIQAGHRAAIAEEDRPDVFTLRVGNLMPGEAASVQLDLSGPISFADGEATLRFPLVVAPRYVPGVPLERTQVGSGTAPDTDAAPDASRITPAVLLPGYPNPVRLSLAMEIDAQPPTSDFRCSLHAVLESTNERGTRRIVLHPGERLDRDFILRWQVGGKTVSSVLICTPDRKVAREGTFALTLVPPVGHAASQRPRDVAFVLDRSGSMGGWKIVAARRAMARMVQTLTPRDRFTALAFDDRVDVPGGFVAKNLVSATERNRYLADQFFARLDARGGTEMAVPLELAAEALCETSSERERVLVLVTDGQVGNEDQILAHLAPKIRGARVFTLGIDQAVNAGFLNRLAGLGRGSCELIESEARLDEVIDRVHRHLGTPVLTGVRLEAIGFNLVPDSVVPTRLPDLFAGSALTVFGRYRGSPGSIAVHACGSAVDPWQSSVAAAVAEAPAVEHAWARAQVRTLEDRYAVGPNAKLAQQIVETSVRFGVLCRFTAFVAVDRSEVVNAGGELHAITQPVETPAGWMPPKQQPAGIRMTLGGGGGGIGMGMSPRQDQRMLLAPRMIQSLEILQLPLVDLQAKIEKELQENPFLKQQEKHAKSKEESTDFNRYAPLRHDETGDLEFSRLDELNRDWDNHFDEEQQVDRGALDAEGDRKLDAMANKADRPQSLQDQLAQQLEELELDEDRRRLARHICGFVDHTGYLGTREKASDEDNEDMFRTVTLAEIAAEYDTFVTEEEIEETLVEVVQTLEPAGVGARDLKECLLLQATADTPYRDVLLVLIRDHLGDIAGNRIPAIQKATKFDIPSIQAAIEVLHHLDPKPGLKFADGETPHLIPDVIVERTDDDGFDIRLTDVWGTKVRICRRTVDLIKNQGLDDQVREELRKKLQSADWFVKAVEQRRNTLLKVTRAIIEHQRPFFDLGVEHIQPLQLQRIADEVKVHVTTVSRAVDGKWVQTPRGVFLLNRFFGKPTDAANERIRQKVLELLSNEDTSSPLSDEDLVRMLHYLGYPVARRAVTKFRNLLKIPSSRLRKNWSLS